MIKENFSLKDLNFNLWVQKICIKWYYLFIFLLLFLRLYKLLDIFLLLFSSIIILIYFLYNKIKISSKLNQWLIHLPFSIWLVIFLFSRNGVKDFVTKSLIIENELLTICFSLIFLTTFYVVLLKEVWVYICNRIYKIKYLCNQFNSPPEENTSLHYLVYQGNIKQIKKLFQEKLIKEKDIHKKDEYGRYPIHLARDVKTFSFLVSQGLKIDKENIYSGQTLLHLSVRRENLEVVKFLIKKRADINKKDMRKRSPLDYAKSNEMRNFLIAKGGKETILQKRIKHFLLKKMKLVKNTGNDLS